MTCIVAISNSKKVIMGSDSSSISGIHNNPTSLTKVFIRDKFLLGYTTSFRMGQLLQYRLEIEKKPKDQDSLEFMATTFIDAVRSCLKTGGFRKLDNEQEEGGNFLVGYSGQLYIVESDFQVNKTITNFAAIGAGDAYALGSLQSTKNDKSKIRIKKALKASNYFCTDVCPPFIIKEL